jgi:hypothetical protein
VGVPTPDVPVNRELDEATKNAMAGIISKIEQLRRDITSTVSSREYQGKLVEQILAADSFNEVVESKMVPVHQRLDRIEQLLGELLGQGEPQPADDVARIIGFRITLHNEQSEAASYQALRHGANHPTDPDGVELYVDDDGHGHWHIQQISTLVRDALREAFDAVQTQPEQRYWCEIIQLTDRPVNEASVKVTPATPLPTVRPHVHKSSSY